MKYLSFKEAIEVLSKELKQEIEIKHYDNTKGCYAEFFIFSTPYKFFHSCWNDFGLHIPLTRKGRKFYKICDFHKTPDDILNLLLLINKNAKKYKDEK